MGRGQDSLARDQFSHVFGDRRGSSRPATWEERGEKRVILARWREAGVEPRKAVVFVFSGRLGVEEGQEAISKVAKIFEVSEGRGCGALLDAVNGRDMIYVMREDVVGLPSLPTIARTLTLVLGTGVEAMIPASFEGDEATSPQRMLLRTVGTVE